MPTPADRRRFRSKKAPISRAGKAAVGAGGCGGGVRKEFSEVVVFLFGDFDARDRDIPRCLIFFKISAKFFAAFCPCEYISLIIVTDGVIAGGYRIAIIFPVVNSAITPLFTIPSIFQRPGILVELGET
jgi:hypothetical protein